MKMSARSCYHLRNKILWKPFKAAMYSDARYNLFNKGLNVSATDKQKKMPLQNILNGY